MIKARTISAKGSIGIEDLVAEIAKQRIFAPQYGIYQDRDGIRKVGVQRRNK